MSDITITHAHRTALRRAMCGQRLDDLEHLGPTLVSAGLLWLISADRLSGYGITDDGRAVLRAHEAVALPATRRIDEHRPLPSGWRVDVVRGYVHDRLRLVRPWGQDAELERAIAETRATLDLLEWIAHSRAVEAQDGES